MHANRIDRPFPWDEPSPSERRGAPRYEAVEFRMHTGWWEEENFVIAACSLDNISCSGAMFLSAHEVPEGCEFWMSLKSDAWSGTARGTVLECRTADGGMFAIRVRFHERCPDEMYQIATLGACRN